MNLKMSHTALTLSVFQKKKVLTAYQIFYKEYRNSILEEEPGLGEFSPKSTKCLF